MKTLKPDKRFTPLESAIMSLFNSDKPLWSLREIARELGCSEGSASGVIHTFKKQGYHVGKDTMRIRPKIKGARFGARCARFCIA